MIRSERLDVFKWLDKDGVEIPDDQPMEVPSGFKEPETLAQTIQRLVRSEDFQRHVMQEGAETFEESEDFDVPDETYDWTSPYEEVFDPVLGRAITPEEFKKYEAVYKERFLKAEAEAYEKMHISDALRIRPRPVDKSGPEADTKKVDKPAEK